MRTVHVIQNSEIEGPGFILDWTKKRKFTAQVVKNYAGEALPPAEDVELLIVLGHPSARAADKDLWIEALREWLPKVLAQETLVLALGFAARLSAQMAGAKIEADKSEFGWHEIRFASAALTRPSALLFQWVGENFSLPPGARPLAKSRGIAVNGFQKGHVSAVNSLLQITPAIAKALGAQGEMLNDLEARCAASNKFAHDFLDLWSESTFPAETPLKIIYR